VQDELPLAAREEDAEGEIGAEKSCDEDGGEGFEYPADLDEGDHLGGGVAALGVVAGLEAGGLGRGFGAGFLRVFGHGSFALRSASHGERLKENGVGTVGEVVWGGGGSEDERGDGGGGADS